MRPTISLALIAKNEAPNVKRLFDSVEGCFDEIVFVDTGSDDGTQDIARDLGATVYHFDWVHDFSAARNFSFSKVKTDFVMWLDLDDVLKGKEAFIEFRNSALQYFDYVLATYNYALDATGKPLVSFMRERIFRMSTNPKWNYFVHEGVPPQPGLKIHYSTNWHIDHLRTAEDQAKDKSRNLKIFETKMANNELDGRMTYYYAKELFENQAIDKSLPIFLKALEMPLQPHDKIMALQYACYASLHEIDKLPKERQNEGLDKVVALALAGVHLKPDRAEFWSVIADVHLKQGKLTDALPFYAGAAKCIGQPLAGDPYAGAIHSMRALYEDYPRNKMGQILFHLNKREDAEAIVKESAEKFNSAEAKKMLEELSVIKKIEDLNASKTKVDDIVFTCPPVSAYPFDEEIYKTKGMGGSETALIEMAKWLKKLTGRQVKVFNMRSETLISESGVEYISAGHTKDYFHRYEPALHIAWRHNEKLTNAPSYLWCHDLMIPGVERGLNQDYVLSLSPFHKGFLAGAQGVDAEKILLTRNGISPEKWEGIQPKPKNPNKFVYASSPDRGLDRVMHILDLVRKQYPVELHVYYGLENLYKFGQAELGDKLKKMMAERPWVHYHGFTEQKEMYAQCSDAAVWMHCNDFIETFCITALEMLANGVYPITRRWGAIQDTLKEAEELKMARLLDMDSVTPDEHLIWAQEAIKAIEERSWERVKVDPKKYAWSEVAREWVSLFKL